MVMEVAETGWAARPLEVGSETPPLALRRVRRDALPEEIQYRDDGCDIHPHCLTCPLPRCRYDEPGGLRAMINAYRDQRIIALRGEGAAVDEIAERYSLSRRTVFRILSASSRQALSSAPGGLNAGPSASSRQALEEATPAGWGRTEIGKL